jgi:hypothetical protein
MANLRVLMDPTVPKYTILYTSDPNVSPEEHEAEHAKYFKILRDLLQKQGIDTAGAQLEVKRIAREAVPEPMQPDPNWDRNKNKVSP